MRGLRGIVCAFIALAAWCGVRGDARASSLRCDPCTMPVLGTSFRVTGTIDDAGVAITGYAPQWKLGALVLGHVTISAHQRGAGLDACVAADLAGGRIVACSRLPGTFEQLGDLHAADVTWQLKGPASGRGTARLAWTSAGEVRLERATVELALAPRMLGSVALGHTTVHADVSGVLSQLALDIRGRAHADTVDAGPVHLAEITLPIDVLVEPKQLVPRTALVASVGRATLDAGDRVLAFEGVAIEVHDARASDWSTVAALDHRVTWRAMAGLPVAVGTGELGIQVAGGVQISSGHAALLGGELVVEPFALVDREIVVHVQGLVVAQVLAAISHGRVDGTGLFDGDFVVRHDAAGLALDRGALHARSDGALRLHEPLWPDATTSSVMGFSIHRRVALALANFHYDRWTLTVQPPGRDPESIMALHGRGARVAQELDLEFHLRGVRGARVR